MYKNKNVENFNTLNSRLEQQNIIKDFLLYIQMNDVREYVKHLVDLNLHKRMNPYQCTMMDSIGPSLDVLDFSQKQHSNRVAAFR